VHTATWNRNLLVIALSLSLSCAQGFHAESESAVRIALEREYAAIMDGFLRNDPNPWIERLGPEFQLILFNGSTQSRDWAVSYVKNNANTFHVGTLTMRIKTLQLTAGHWVATVEQLSSRTWSDSTGPHRLEVGAIQLETWERRGSRWKLASVQEKEILYLRRDQ
jgi:hypothetical protein